MIAGKMSGGLRENFSRRRCWGRERLDVDREDIINQGKLIFLLGFRWIDADSPEHHVPSQECAVALEWCALIPNFDSPVADGILAPVEGSAGQPREMQKVLTSVLPT